MAALQILSMRVGVGMAALQILVMFLVAVAVAANHPPNNATDLHSLLAFKSNLESHPLNSLASWTPNVSFCSWSGVTCSLRRQRVVSLNVSNVALQGSISPLLFNLSFLRILDLSSNSLYGYIPYQLGRLSRLRELNLSHNSLGGPIPSSLGACRSLQHIDMYQNHLTGNIPSQLGFLPNLDYFNIGRNNLSGKIPNFLGNISSLTQMSLKENKFDGQIPWELGMLNHLTVLCLEINYLTGEIPSSLSNCTLLQCLSVCSNALTGKIPPELFSKNTHWTRLYLDQNELSGQIPVTLFNCTQLVILELSDNRLSGVVPSELGKLSRLTFLNLGLNRFVSSGSISLPFLTALTNCSQLITLWLGDNHLTEVIPSSVGQLSSKLERFALYSNQMRGEIPPQIGNLSHLTLLNLAGNNFSGSIPSTLNRLQRLERLFLGGNSLEGNIPPEIGQLSKLGLLALDYNKLSGNIPDSLSQLKEIRYLGLLKNNLSGSIPPSLGECFKLQRLDLSYNRLSGHIPREIASLPNLDMYFNLSNNLLNGSLPSEVGKLERITAIDVSANQLTGHIPDAIGSCIALEYLNLSSNKVGGSIPTYLAQLKNLMVADFSSNNLSGNIPMFLAKLKALQQLNLSFNQLSGEVPKDGVFKNHSRSSFVGNLGLCGPWVNLPACLTPKHKKSWNVKRVVLPIIGAIIFIWFFFMGFLWRYYRMKSHSSLSHARRFSKLEHQRISYTDLIAATDGFNEANLLGVGSSGKVYRGALKDGIMVAVKVLNMQIEDAFKSFNKECSVLRQVRHRNLLRIITSYSDPDFKALIFPLVPNGSLDKFLYPEGEQVCRLDLIQRLSVAMEIAQGIEYLHHYCFVQVIHCDLKPSNVLLGEDFTAYITDFGISRLVNGNSTDLHTSTHTLKGSIGYIAPEYGLNGAVTIKGDVYSYGIVLLELMTRKKPTDSMFVDGMNLPKWTSQHFPDRIVEVVDACLLSAATSNEEEKSFECLKQLINLAMLCAKESPEERPSMIDIVSILHSIRDTYLGATAITSRLQTDLPSLLASTSKAGSKLRNSDSETSSTF